MISANDARALMEHGYLKIIEQKIIAAATKGYGKLEFIQEGDHDTEVIRECLEKAGYKINIQGYLKDDVMWEIIWSN